MTCTTITCSICKQRQLHIGFPVRFGRRVRLDLIEEQTGWRLFGTEEGLGPVCPECDKKMLDALDKVVHLNKI